MLFLKGHAMNRINLERMNRSDRRDVFHFP